MDKKTQDLAWACLPKEARDEIKMIFNMPSKYGYPDSIRRCLLDIYGDNLTSDTEPEEMLTVEKSKVQHLYEEQKKFSNEKRCDAWKDYEVRDVILVVLKELFGDKCLPDNTDSKGIDCNKLDQMLDEALAKETPESLNKWLDEQNHSSQTGSGFKKGDIVKFMGDYCKVTNCPTEPHYALSYLVGAHRGQAVVGLIKESHIKACPEFEAIPFKIGDRVRERDYEESVGTVAAFNVNEKCEITMFVQLDKEDRYIEGYPDEFVAIPPKPKFNIGDKVVGNNEHTAKEWPGVMEVTDYKFEKGKSRYLYYTREFGNIWFPESTLKLYVEIPPKSELKFHKGDEVINLLTGEVHIIQDTDFQDGVWSYLVFDSEDNSKWLNESDLAPYTEPETKDNMEEKELNLCELLNLGDTIYNPTFGYGRVDLVNTDIKPYFCVSFEDAVVSLSFLYNGIEVNSNSRPSVWPNEELYEKYPLDAYSAWMEWKEARRPKRWRAEYGEMYYSLRNDFSVCDQYENNDFVNDEAWEKYNYFRTEEEAQQAAEAVRETLKKFRKEHTPKPDK